MSETNYGLGRIEAPDSRDLNFLLSAVVPEPSTRTHRNWNTTGWWGNQGEEPKCVGFAWAHYIEDGPVTHKGRAPVADPHRLYTRAQDIDEWPGTGYSGTSVRAGAKTLNEWGYIGEYRWEFTLSGMINALLEVGPVVIGVNWYERMFKPDEKGLIKIGGGVAGGHAIKADGVNMKTKLIRLKNSWGRNWGKKGFCFLSFADMEQLIHERGEVCIATEIKDPKI